MLSSRFIIAAGMAAITAVTIMPVEPATARDDEQAVSGVTPADCSSYVGQTVAVSSFAELHDALPIVTPRDRFESAADYTTRLASAELADPKPVIIRKIWQAGDEGMSYNTDSQTLTVYGSAFGAGRTNFREIMGLPIQRGRDNFASAIGFELNVTQTAQETFEATNGFGAKFAVTRTIRHIDTVWERAGEIGEDPFLGMRSGRLAILTMEAPVARELFENGSAALLFVSRPPFRDSGTSTIGAEFSRPRERQDNVDVLIGDIQCGFLLNAQDQVTHAFTTK